MAIARALAEPFAVCPEVNGALVAELRDCLVKNEAPWDAVKQSITNALRFTADSSIIEDLEALSRDVRGSFLEEDINEALVKAREKTSQRITRARL